MTDKKILNKDEIENTLITISDDSFNALVSIAKDNAYQHDENGNPVHLSMEDTIQLLINVYSEFVLSHQT